MIVENTWSDAVRPVVVVVSVRLDGDPLASTMLPLASVHAVDGLAVGGNATEKPGGATPMIAAASGARSELCWDTWWRPAESSQSTTTARRLPVWVASPHAT